MEVLIFLKRISLETVVRLLLIIFCIILFAIIYDIASRQEEPEITVESIPVASSEHHIEPDEYAEPPLLESPLLYQEVQYIKPITHDQAIEQISILDRSINSLRLECTSGLYQELAVGSMQAEIERLIDIKGAIVADIECFIRWEAEYPYATKVWYFLRENSYSEEVAAGIIGNMMIETSGGSLSLKPTVYSPTRNYYGLCQWSLYYRPEVADMSFEDQLEYLHADIEKEFSTFGFCYKYGFTFEDFLAITDPAEAALAFAKIYERCGSGSYILRKRAAEKAFDYFTN
jgi:hypothetical protein